MNNKFYFKLYLSSLVFTNICFIIANNYLSNLNMQEEQGIPFDQAISEPYKHIIAELGQNSPTINDNAGYNDTPENKNSPKQNITAISLGPDCQVAGQLRIANIRTQAFPFDWMATHSFEGVFKVLQEDFKHFLNKNFLVKDTDQIRVLNTHYNILFVHDFPTVENPVVNEFNYASKIPDNFLDYVDEVKKKFDRRITRVRDLLRSINHKLLLIRTSLLPNQALTLSNFLTKNYPKLNYTIVSVHNNPNLNYNWKIKGVKNFYVTKLASGTEPGAGNYFAPSEWQKVFRSLKILN